jgi:cysteine sulfinate desulfinase/cysteine desulfurase-like protein
VNESRIYLDAQGGQHPNQTISDMSKAMLSLSWNDGKSRHFEAAASQTAREIAIDTLAKGFGVKANQIVPIHRLGNVFEILAELYPDSAVSSVSRKGALQSFTGTKLTVDNVGRINQFTGYKSFFAPAANQETGVIENLEQISSKTGALAIVDATEWIGRTKNLPAGEILIAKASSWAGPNSVCFIISKDQSIEIDARKRAQLMPDDFALLWAASAFENLGDISETEERIRGFSIEICGALASFNQITIHGDKHALPHLISFDIKNVDSETAALTFDKFAIAVGSGSACAVSNSQSSHVLEAMGVASAGNVRLSIPLDFEQKDVDFFVEKLPAIVAELTQTL